MDYVVIYEKGDSSYGAYVPDLPGCIAVGETLEEVQMLIHEAIEFHVEGLEEDGDDIPQPSLNIFIQYDIPYLGIHKVVENYVHNDDPALFSCKDSAGHLYLVIVGENDEYKTWIRVGISKERFNLIRSGGIDLRNAFTEAENGILFQVRIPQDDPKKPSLEVIQPNQISEDILPLPGERLGLKTEETITIRGTLVGISVRDKTFQLETSDENFYEKDYFKGKIVEEAYETEVVKNATVSKTYIAEIQGVVERGETKDESNIKFRLLSLNK